MAQTITERILAAHSGRYEIHAGDIVIGADSCSCLVEWVKGRVGADA